MAAGYTLQYEAPAIRMRQYRAQLEGGAELTDTQRCYRAGYITCLDEYKAAAAVDMLPTEPQHPHQRAIEFAHELKISRFRRDGNFCNSYKKLYVLTPCQVAFRAGYLQCMADKAEEWRRSNK
jgi:hypothetical protein